MSGWVYVLAYVVCWLITCRVLARYVPEARRDGPFLLGVAALFWPLIAAGALFALPVWLVTRGVDR
ncbi:hypothetical protein [Micromonospora aurantiaca (nom. illeg.)]|uniref:hypothetical protein n=1 Tax=Micromonospora aurantiaca (nom. illeg.) TaxID=47850 RepID=UPI00342382EB